MYNTGCIVILFLCIVNVSDIFVSAAVLPNKDLYRLDIIHYNDFHDRFEETSVPYPICKSNDSECLGGFARLFHEVMVLVNEKPDALVLNAGDTFHGTYWYTLLKWNITQKFINMLPNDAHAIGNHEFDDGVLGLVPYLAALKAPVVAANMDSSQEPSLQGLYQPHIIAERKGRKIGIIGLVTLDTATTSSPENVKFLDPIETVKREAQKLTDEGVDIIVVLSHCGLNVDIEMAQKVGENLDIIVGGHTHSLLWNGTAPSNEDVSGPYPMTINSQENPKHKVLVVTASAFTKYLGNLTTYFDEMGELQSFDGYPVFLNRSIPEDQTLKSLLEPYKQELHKIVDEVVGYSNEDLLGFSCNYGECKLGDLAIDSFLNATLEKYETNLSSVGFFVRNMIKGSLPQGDISRGAIINTLPLNNKIVTAVIQGRYLLETFEICLTKFWTTNPFAGPWVPSVAGMKLTLNTTSGKVVTASVKDGGQDTPLDPDQEYQLTTMQFLLRGGNGFKALKEQSRDTKEVGMDVDILEKHIKKTSPISIELDNRLTLVN